LGDWDGVEEGNIEVGVDQSVRVLACGIVTENG
jgi:hypothetical protein